MTETLLEGGEPELGAQGDKLPEKEICARISPHWGGTNNTQHPTRSKYPPADRRECPSQRGKGFSWGGERLTLGGNMGSHGKGTQAPTSRGGWVVITPG